jgi:hypothetical protein
LDSWKKLVCKCWFFGSLSHLIFSSSTLWNSLLFIENERRICGVLESEGCCNFWVILFLLNVWFPFSQLMDKLVNTIVLNQIDQKREGGLRSRYSSCLSFSEGIKLDNSCPDYMLRSSRICFRLRVNELFPSCWWFQACWLWYPCANTVERMQFSMLEFCDVGFWAPKLALTWMAWP